MPNKAFKTEKKSRRLTGGGPPHSIKEGEEEIHEMFKDTPAFNGVSVFTAGSQRNSTVSGRQTNDSDSSSSGEEVESVSPCTIPREMRGEKEEVHGKINKKRKRSERTDIYEMEEKIQAKRLQILEIEYEVKKKELEIKKIELEKMEIALRTSTLMSNNIDLLIENAEN